MRVVEQLVLPTQCRPLVLRLAHDVPTAGHLGTTKTQNRVLQQYYWPGMFKENVDTVQPVRCLNAAEEGGQLERR